MNAYLELRGAYLLHNILHRDELESLDFSVIVLGYEVLRWNVFNSNMLLQDVPTARVQSSYIGCNTGNGEKLCSSQLAQATYLAVA